VNSGKDESVTYPAYRFPLHAPVRRVSRPKTLISTVVSGVQRDGQGTGGGYGENSWEGEAKQLEGDVEGWHTEPLSVDVV
jgi:hypothetical protein